jgi:two-component system NtrC family sensor kinase
MAGADNFYLQVLEVSPNPLFLLNCQGKVILWNRACELFTGVEAADVLNTDGHKLVFYPGTSPPRSTLADILVAGKQAELENFYTAEQQPQIVGDHLQAEGWYPNLGGKDRYITFTAVPLRTPDGDLVAVLETFHDITDRRLNLQKISRLFDQVCAAKRHWEATMDCIDDLVLVVDAAGKIQRCNRSVLNLNNNDLSFNDILQSNWRNLLTEGGIDFQPPGGRENECYFPATDRWFLVKEYDFRNADNNGENWTVVTLHDLTEVRRMSMELEQAHAELKATQSQILHSEKMASIGQLAAGVAHEINNPVGFVKSNLNTLGKYVAKLAAFMEHQEQVIADHADAEAKELIGRLRKEAKLNFLLEDALELQNESLDGIDRVSKIVQDLKSFSRVDQAEYSNVDLNACLESTLNIVINELKYSATLEKELGELPLVACYPQQINQVLLNILVNAGHAIGEKGEIRIRSWHQDDWVCLAISDSGCGIPEENLARLFEPFFTTKDVGKGTGLGLSISYDIIKKHGGDILVESQLNQGTTFTVRLPVQPPED